MFKLISKENQSILFNEKEIKLSVFLSMFETNFDKEDEIPELKIEKISIDLLAKIKKMLEIIVKKNITLDILKKKNLLYYDLLKYLQISEHFQQKDFFKLLDICNYLHIEILLFLMVQYLKDIIKDSTPNDINLMFNLTEDDYPEKDNNRIKLLNSILS
tara:strand:+ start:1245 stop:1721 length:477 start_codon:yes stop_codon:yes gene_type:complete